MHQRNPTQRRPALKCPHFFGLDGDRHSTQCPGCPPTVSKEAACASRYR
ncbi:hypothetical protein NSERUTF1_3593 [Nocardia seriolae]|nr:hypothetical protein NSERUTF1_3593 [Nocardia seriolae]